MTGTFKSNDLIAGIAQVEEGLHQLFNVTVEPAEENNRAFRLGRRERVRGQESFDVAIGVRYCVAISLRQTINRSDRGQELLAGCFAVGVVGAHKDLGGAIVVASAKDMPLS